MKSKLVKKRSVRGKSVKTAETEDGGTMEEKSRLERKQTKHLHFLTKLEGGRQTLSASKTVGKKRRKRTREKAAKVLDSLSSLAESLPSKGEIMSSGKTFHKNVLHKKSHQQVVAKETKQLAAVLAHPEFQINPFLAIQQHLTNTLPAGELPSKKEQGTMKNKKSIKKRTSVQHMNE